MERRRLTACGHDLHMAKDGTRWGVCVEPETGDVFGGPCNGAALDEQPGDTLGQDWREHWRRGTEQPLHDGEDHVG